MHQKYRSLHASLVTKLSQYDTQVKTLPGLDIPGAVDALAWQLVDSQRKIDRTKALAERDLSPDRLRPSSPLFDPEMGAVLANRAGDLDEACWLSFMSVHFGRHGSDGWSLVAKVYGALGGDPFWTWARFRDDPEAFRSWMADTLRSRNTPLGRFGNHRSRETLRADLNNGTPSVFVSYLKWIDNAGGHRELIGAAVEHGDNPEGTFDHLYQSMRAVRRFGRLGRFDYVALLGKLGIALVNPGSTYVAEGTGPLAGARLLFGGSRTYSVRGDEAERWADKLARHIGLGMQAVEDALCNWQKHPSAFKAFRG